MADMSRYVPLPAKGNCIYSNIIRKEATESSIWNLTA